MIFYGLDPGVTTGFAMVKIGEDREWHIEDVAHWNPDQTLEFLGGLLIEPNDWILVVEDYIINPKVHRYDHQGDKGIALRLIGAAELIKKRRPDRVVEFQQNFRKPTGYGFLGKTYVRGKGGQHMWDALAHVAYYVVLHGFAAPIETSKQPAPVVQKRLTPRIFHPQSHSQWRRPDK